MTEEKKTGGAGVHRRRPHYSGKYPKKFEEKYKELDPERYPETAEKVIAKGSTPAGTHLPIMVAEIMDFLQVQPGQTGLDCTLGYGGHSSEILRRLGGQGHLYGLDADPIEIRKTEERLRAKGYGAEIFTAVHTNFRNIDRIAAQYGPFDFVMADLGVSSMQIDDPSRGFSYKMDGPLDLRFDPSRGESAAERLKSLSKEEIAGMLEENSDEPYADRIAETLDRARRRRQSPETTEQLRDLIETALAFLPAGERRDAVKKSCARTFQALRIDVNSEFEVLQEFPEKLTGALVSGGRCAVLTFHSGEDRLVKKEFQLGERDGIYREVAKNVIRPGHEECYRNPRAHSAKLRWAVRA